MDIEPNGIYAVITGDVVKSSALPAVERRELAALLRSSYSELQEIYPVALPLPLSVFRGDSWQMLVTVPEQSLSVGLSFRSLFLFKTGKARTEKKELDTRIAIGIGGIDFVPDDGVHEGDGPAFRRSGKALEALGAPTRMGFSFPDSGNERALSLIVELLDALVMGWTPPQALAVVGGLQGLTQEEIGKGWPDKRITQQAVQSHLTAARWGTVESAVEFFRGSLAS